MPSHPCEERPENALSQSAEAVNFGDARAEAVGQFWGFLAVEIERDF